MTDVLEPDVFERQAGEPAAAYAHFLAFCNLGPGRKVKKTAENGNISPSRLYTLASKWRWAERAAAFDCDRERTVQAEVYQQSVRLRRIQMSVAAAMLRASMQNLTAMTAEKAEALTPTEVARWSKTANDLARGALGMPDQTIALGTTDPAGAFTPLAGMDDAQQRAELGACLVEIGTRMSAGEALDDQDEIMKLIAGGSA